jgi:uncharacterized protein involved in exopolysaccharide biosynthesis
VASATGSSANGDISVRDLAADIRRARLLVIGSAVVLAIAGAIWGLIRHKQYQASTVVVAAASDDSSHLGGLGAIAAQYGGLASLAGVNLPTSGRRNEAIAVLQSELLTERYLKDQDLLPMLFQSRSRRLLARLGLHMEGSQPTLWKANQYFKKQIRIVSEDKATGLITLKITWIDPELAAKWANDLVHLTNSYLRDKATAEAERNIAYLNEEASKTNVLEARTAIYSLLKDEINNEMIARGREEYALKVIDPAFAPEKPSSLGSVALAFFGLFLGLGLSVMFVLGKRIFIYS